MKKNPFTIAVMLRSLISILIAASSVAAAGFKAGDEVEIARKVTLAFKGQAFKEVKAGERFKVAVHRPNEKRVYLFVQSKGGQNIAVSVEEDAVRLIPLSQPPANPLRQRALDVARAGQTKEALGFIEAARQAESANPELMEVRNAIVDAGAAIEKLAAAKIQQVKAATEAARIEKNATLVDRPNRLFPNDDSNQRRADAMRKQAKQVRQTASDSLHSATATYENAMAVLRTLGSPASSKKPGMPPPTSVTGGGVGASGKSVVEKTETALLPEELKILNKSAAQCFLTTPNIQNAYPSLTTLIGSFGELAVAKRIKVIERIKETRTLLPHLTDSQFFTLWKELKLEWQETRIQDLQFLTEQVADSLSAAAVSGTESTLESIKSASLSMTMTKRGFLGSEACRRAIALVNIYLESDDTARKTPTRSLDNRTMEDMVTGPHGLVKSMSEADSSVFGSVSKFDFLLGGPNAFADQLFNQVGVRASKLTPSEYVRAGECLDYAKLWRISADEIITEAAFRVRELGGLTDDIWEAIGSLQGMKNLMKKLGPLSAFTKQDLVLEIARGQFPNLSDTMLRDFASHFEKGAQAWTGKLRGGPIFR